MATKRTDLEVNVVANAGQAKRELGEVSADVKELEGQHEIDISVDDDATDDLAAIRDKLDALTEKDREIALKGQASHLETEIKRAEKALGRLDKYDQQEIDIRVEARDNATRKLKAIRDELDQLDRASADVDVGATGGIGGGGGGGGPTILPGGAAGGLGKALAGGAAAAGAVNIANNFRDASIDAQTLATATGSTVEEASRLLFVAESAGLEYADVFDILSNMNSVLRDTPELAERLNVDTRESGIDQFIAAVGGLQTEIDDTGERGVLSAQLFGEEGNRQIGRLQTLVGDLSTAIEDVPSAAVLTDADVETAKEYNTELLKLKETAIIIGRGAARAGISVGIPAVEDFLNGGNVNRDFPQHPEGSDFLSRISFGLLGGGAPVTTSTGARPLRDPSDVNSGGVTIINPPGTPAATVDNTRRYGGRNGPR